MEQGGDMPGVSMHDLREDVGIDVAECVLQGVDESVSVIERDSDLELPNKEITHALGSLNEGASLWPGGAAR